MRAYLIENFGIDQLSVVEQGDLSPAADEVVIRFRAASINYRDQMVVSGTYNPRMKLPAVPFSDGAGEVVETGKNVRSWKIGDRVMPIFAQRWFDGDSSEEKRRTSLGAGAQWNGVLREYGAFREDAIVSIPEHLSFDEASTLPCAALTAWNALIESGRLGPSDTVLTLGTGGVSVFAIQIAKLSGAKVIATTGSSQKEVRLRQLGVDAVINYRSDPDWQKRVIELSGGGGVDHVVEVGGAGTIARSITAARIGGHVAMVGALSGAASFDPVTVFMKAIRLQGIFVGSKRMLLDLNRAISVNQLRPVVDRVFEFEEAREALRYVGAGSHFGKVVVRI